MVLRWKPPNPTRLHLAFLTRLCDPHLIQPAPGPSNRAYLSLPSAQQPRRGLARLRPFTPVLHLHRANQAAAHTCNTPPRVSPHNVVNHSSLRSDHSGPRTLLVLNLPLDECIDNTHSHHMKNKRKINNQTTQAPQVIRNMIT